MSEPTPPNQLQLHGLSVRYGNAGRGVGGGGGGSSGANAVDGLDLAVPKGQLVSLLGPSGCGKTTTMRAVAGLLAPHAGRIELAGHDITRLAPHKRDIGLVFQSYALFPHLSVFDNVAFGLRLRRVPAVALRQRTLQALGAVGLVSLAGRLPAQLSGGQQQRVALARALVILPRLLLLDEPLSNLDARLRVEMRAELRRLQRESGITMLYVTHDQDEALALSDRIVVMNAGRIEQDAPPDVVWHRPATPFVASFMGFENLFERALLQQLFPQPMVQALSLADGVTHVAWRAQAVAVRPPGAAALAGVVLAGVVLSRSYGGDHTAFDVQTAAGIVVKAVAPAAAAAWRDGDAVSLAFDTGAAAPIGANAVGGGGSAVPPLPPVPQPPPVPPPRSNPAADQPAATRASRR